MKDLTLITCSYETPIVTETLLRSYVHRHGRGPHDLVLMENSRNNETQTILDNLAIPYIRTPGGGHSPSVDTALKVCNTRYALLVDTDIIFNANLTQLFEKFKNENYAIMGEVCGDRAGFKLYPRVHPWFCLMDLDKVGKFHYHDQERIDKTDSNVFYTKVPLTHRTDHRRYDVGATFLEDIMNARLKIGTLKYDTRLYTHYEGMSWYKNAQMAMFDQMQKTREEQYKKQVEFLKTIDIRGCFR